MTLVFWCPKDGLFENTVFGCESPVIPFHSPEILQVILLSASVSWGSA